MSQAQTLTRFDRVPLFTHDSTLSQEAKDSINKFVLRPMRRYRAIVITVSEHIQTKTGIPEMMLAETSRDVRACRDYMVSQGIDPARIIMCPNSNWGLHGVAFDMVHVYYVPMLQPILFNIVGTVIDSLTHKPISNATVHMLGTDGTDIPHQTDSTGHYQFYPYDFNDGVSYKLKVNPPASYGGYGYIDNNKCISTDGLKESKEFIVDFALLHVKQL